MNGTLSAIVIFTACRAITNMHTLIIEMTTIIVHDAIETLGVDEKRSARKSLMVVTSIRDAWRATVITRDGTIRTKTVIVGEISKNSDAMPKLRQSK